jgi:hypothetical protein
VIDCHKRVRIYFRHVFGGFRLSKLHFFGVISYETEDIANGAGEFAVCRFGAKGCVKLEWGGMVDSEKNVSKKSKGGGCGRGPTG